jgi:hypothetical protein
MDSATKREIDLLWEHGIKALRNDIQDLGSNITSSRRWLIGLLVSMIPVYAGVIITLLKRWEFMTDATNCQTSGTQYHTTITPTGVSCSVEFSTPIELTEEEAAILDTNMHNAMELVLARYFEQERK